MNYRGWMLIGLSRDYPKGKIKARTFMNEDCLVFRTESGQLNVIEPYCSHYGVNMATGRVAKDFIVCPMHSRAFKGNGECAKSGGQSIRSYQVSESRGLAFAYFDEPGVEPQWDAPQFLNESEFPDILWSHSRMLELHHPSVPLNNAVDPRHFQETHRFFGKVIQDGQFRAEEHEAFCTMATELLPPLSIAARGPTAMVTSYFNGPLNNYLKSDMGSNVSHMCNFVTIIEGNRCLLTQVGIGRKSLNPLRLFEDFVGCVGSWHATWEDAPVWNNRKVQTPDKDPNQTDEAIEQFQNWFDSFEFESTPSGPGSKLQEPVKLAAVVNA